MENNKVFRSSYASVFSIIFLQNIYTKLTALTLTRLLLCSDLVNPIPVSHNESLN